MELELLKKEDAYRVLKPIKSSNINLSTNDYLGIAQNKELLKEFNQKHTDIDLTASSSRLLSGNHQYYSKIEEKLSELYASESALFFNSGYHLNVGVLPTVTTKHDLILADKLVHASLIEAFKLSSAKVIRYKHLDYSQLESLLQKYQSEYDNIFIVSESIFSMDGDVVDLVELIRLKKEFGAYLYLDEAHAVGAMGAKGLGLSEQEGLVSDIDFLVGTMGKALASIGAYLVCSKDVKSYLVNKCKSLIYTTALPPINVAWSLFLLDIIPRYSKERESLKLKSEYLRNTLIEKGVGVKGETHILAVLVGENSRCISLSKQLEEHGVIVQAIRPPTVPMGTSRIRISLHEKLTYQDLDKLAELMVSFK